MTLSMYAASGPIFDKTLGNVIQWLDKAEAYAAERGFDPQVYLTARLAPDMLPFPKQIQIASDAAKGCMARLAGMEAVKFVDDEDSIARLRDRVQRTIDFVRSVPAADVDGSEERAIVLPRRGREPLHFTGEAYLKHFALPNFFFHCTTTYALLRHNGVPLGKTDFLG